MGEIDKAHNAKGEGQANTDETIDTSEKNTIDDSLGKKHRVHRDSPYEAI
jgi:hypothetical protein